MNHHENTTSAYETLRNCSILSEILLTVHVDTAVVLVAPIQDLKKRSLKRSIVEPDLRPEHVTDYPSSLIADLYDSVDLYLLYESLFRLLSEHKISVNCVESIVRDSTVTPSFKSIDRLFVHKSLRGQAYQPPSENEVLQLIELPGMHYQTIDLPYGIQSNPGVYEHVTSGRSSTFSKIFADYDLRGSSILDVGCALGEFLLRAERRGAQVLTGLEPHSERNQAAVKTAETLNSQMKIRAMTLDQYSQEASRSGAKEKYDWVIALNVLHHVSDLHQFSQILVSLSKKYIAIEYPTLADPLWLDDNGIQNSEFVTSYTSAPLIGIGQRGYDQTFVFSDAAIKALITSSDSSFSLVCLEDSSIKNRRIAVFRKNDSSNETEDLEIIQSPNILGKIKKSAMFLKTRFSINHRR